MDAPADGRNQLLAIGEEDERPATERRRRQQRERTSSLTKTETHRSVITGEPAQTSIF